MSRPTLSPREQRIPELDGVRAIAIWMVLLMHLIFAYPNPPGSLRFVPRPMLQILSHGWLGVDLFFLLSGFLITGILLDTREKPRYFRNFYVRRFLRIMPLYFTVVLVWTFFYRNDWRYFLLSSVFGANLAPLFQIRIPHGPSVLWSLAVEEHFYLLWPWVVLALRRRKILALGIVLFVGCPLLRGVYAAQGMNPEVIYGLSWFRFDGLAAGAILALWAGSKFCEKRRTLAIAGLLLVLLTLLSWVGARFGLFGTKTPVAVALRYTQAYLGFVAALVLIYVYRGTRWTAILRNRVMQVSGALSYCLYLVHLSVGDAYQRIYESQNVVRFAPGVATAIRVIVVLAVSFAIALLSRKYLEEPVLAMKRSFAPPLRPEVAASPILPSAA